MEEIKALQVSKPLDVSLLHKVRKHESRGGLLGWLQRTPVQPTFTYFDIVQVHHRFTAVGVDHYVELYELEQTEDGATKVNLCGQIDSGQQIKLICTNWSSGSAGNLRCFLAVAGERSLQLYLLDLKSKKLLKRSDVSLKGIHAASFHGETKLLVMVNPSDLIKFDCATSSLVRRPGNLNVALELPAGVQVYGQSLLSSSSDELEETFHYFYFTCVVETKMPQQAGKSSKAKPQEEPQISYIETVYVKELLKKSDGLEDGQVFKVYEVEGEKQLFQKARVVKQKDYFGIQIEDEIEIVHKRHNTYFFFDSILRKRDNQMLYMLEDGLVFSVDEKKVEMSRAQLSQLKCELKNLDVIYFNTDQKGYRLQTVQPIMLDKVPSYGLFFRGEDASQMRVLTMARVGAMNKLMDLVKLKDKELKLPVIQEIGLSLGISKRDFYFELYKQSPKELIDVNEKLLETEDVFTIKREMKYFLRRKRVPLFELLKVYTRIYEMIRSLLRVSLDPKLLKAYIKMNFLTRKMKIQPDMVNTVGFVEFMEIKRRSIVDMLHECIAGDMKLSELSTKDREKAGKQIQKFEAIMRDVLSEFRIVLLENYDSFLKEIISPFSKRLEQLFDKYSFILPRHPYESEFKLALSIKNEPEPAMNKSVVETGGSPQPKIFNAVKEIEWNLEMSRERIIQQLSEYNLTSSVTSAIDAFVASNYYTVSRLTKHAMIPSTRNDYIEHISRNSGSRLFLKACEFANELNLDNKDYSPKRIVERFQKNNNLNGEELIRCMFYAELHLFMWREKVGERPCMEKLLSLSEEDLIAVFFLGNEQKHNLILRELRTLYDDPLIATSNTEELSLFDGVMEKFVNSQNCSPVQMRLLTEAIKEMGAQFQQANQPLIRIIINGFCQRLEVREEDHIKEFLEMFQPVHLNQELNEQMRRVMYIKNQLALFEYFHCEKENVLRLEREGKIVMSRILENYFLGEVNEEEPLTIDGQVISLETPRNMLNVLLYLQETLYSDVTEWEVMVIFGQRMIDYQMFDVLDQIIYKDNVLDTMSIDPVEYVENLIRLSLEKIYDDESIQSFESVKDYMQQILKLQHEQTPQYLVEKSRVRFCELVSESDFIISPHRIYRLKRKDSEQFIIEVIQEGYQTLSLQRLFEIYNCIQIIYGEEPDLTQVEILSYLAKFARVLKDNNKLLEASQVLIYLIDNGRFEDLYSLVTEVVIITLQQKYPENFEVARIYLECYAFNLDSDLAVLDALNCHFDEEKAPEFSQHLTEIRLNPELTFNPLRQFSIDLNRLQDITKQAVKHAGKEISPQGHTFYRYYYFILVALTKPDRGFLLDDIEYDYFILESILERLGAVMASMDEKNEAQYPSLNDYQLRSKFLLGLWRQAQIRAECEAPHQLDLKLLQLQDDFEYVKVISTLKDKKETVLVKIMSRCQKYLSDNRNTNLLRLKKIEKYLAELNKTTHIEIEEVVKPAEEDVCSRSYVDNNKLNRTMTLANYLEEISNRTYNNRNISERQITSMIWEDLAKRGVRSNSPLKELSEAIAEPAEVLHEQLPRPAEDDGNAEEPDRRNYVFELFDQSKYFEIENLDRTELKSYMRQYYESDRNIHSIIKLMQAAKIGEDKNIKIVQSALRIQTPVDIKQLFSFDYYFFVPDHSSREDEAARKEGHFYWEIFNYLTPVLRDMVTAENVLELSKIIYISLKYEKEFEYRIYLLVLEKLIANEPSVPSAKFTTLADEYITKMSISRRFLLNHYAEILNMCRSQDILEAIRQKLLLVLKKKDSKDASQEAVDQTALESAITQIQGFQLA